MIFDVIKSLEIEFDYENLRKSEFDSYERHIIWRYKHLKESEEILSKKDKKVIESYQKYVIHKF